MWYNGSMNTAIDSLIAGRAYDALYQCVLSVNGYDPAIMDPPAVGSVDKLAHIDSRTSAELCRVNRAHSPKLTLNSLYEAAMDLNLVPCVS